MVAIIQDFVQVNKFTRPGTKNSGIKGIVMHWTATPGASAKNEREYFNGTCIRLGRYASAHYFVDRKEIRQIIPENEVAYHANDGTKKNVDFLRPNANFTSLGIELCVEKDGTIHPETVALAEILAAHLLKKYKLGVDKIVRHYDVTTKNCPAPWVAKPALLTSFRKNVDAILNPPKVVAPAKPVEDSYKGFKTHKVVKGDTLSAIAKKYGVTVDSIKKLNNLKTTVINIGQVLKIKADAPATHKVVKGDTLSAISKHYDVKLADILKLNNLKLTSVLKIGQIIKLK